MNTSVTILQQSRQIGLQESFWQEMKKELKFVISCKGTVKHLKSSSEESMSDEEHTDHQRALFAITR